MSRTVPYLALRRVYKPSVIEFVLLGMLLLGELIFWVYFPSKQYEQQGVNHFTLPPPPYVYLTLYSSQKSAELDLPHTLCFQIILAQKSVAVEQKLIC